MAGHESASDFFAHHLTHLRVGSGFWTWHLDTLGMSVLLATIVGFLFYLAARGSSPEAPVYRADPKPSSIRARRKPRRAARFRDPRRAQLTLGWRLRSHL